MYKVVYTESLDNADEIVAESWEYADLQTAIELFNKRVNTLVQEVLDNAFLRTKISIYNHKAFVKIEDKHYCIAVVDDMHKGV